MAKVRGIEIPQTKNGSIPIAELAGLYLLFKARDGDELAVEILNAYGKVFRDANKEIIWPLPKTDTPTTES